MPTIRKDNSKGYFIGFPQTEYYLPEIGSYITVQNFLKHFSIREAIKNNPKSYSNWIIRDEDTIYSIAHRLYGSTLYYWIIAAINDMLNPAWQWPMKDTEILDYVDTKYGLANRNAVHHYEADSIGDNLYQVPAGTWVDATYAYGKTPVTNLAHEKLLNDERRKIKLLLPEYLYKVTQEKTSIIDNNFNRVSRVY